jgi:hypothetical protein
MTPNTPRAPGRPTVADALQQNQLAASAVQQAADELAVVHAVLDQSLPADPRSTDVAEAVRQTDRIEQKLQKAADKLERVNEVLERQAAGA